MREEAILKIIRMGIRTLAHRCDYARSEDHTGFNKFDAPLGHDLADLPDEQWTYKDYISAYRILSHYPRQLQELEIELPTYKELIEELKANFSKPQPQGPERPLITAEEGQIIFYSRFEDRERIKELLPRAKWIADKKAWKLPPVENENLNNFRTLFGEFPTTAEAREILEKAEAKIQAFQDQLQRARRIKGKDQISAVSLPVKVNPYEHQIRAFDFSRSLDHSALLMEQGTGKTLVAVALMGHWHLTNSLQRALIVAPKSVMPEWKRQFEEIANFPLHLELLTGNLEERKNLLENWPSTQGLQVVVINYEATWRLEEELKAWAPQIIVVDESQKIKNGKAEQTKALIALGKQAKHRLILTGTPVTQSPMDFFSQYRFLDNRIFGNSFIKFRNRYAIMGGYGGYKIVGYRNLEELAEKAHSIAFRVTKEECLDLPETINQFVYTDLEPEAMGLYRKMQEDAILKFSETEQVTAPIILTELLRLQQITGGFVPIGENQIKRVSEAKLKAVKEVLEDLRESRKKAVIFARFVPEVEAFAKIARELEMTCFTLTGKTSIEAREKAIKNFQKGDLQVFIAQMATGGVGITLTAADTAIFYSTDFSLANYEQAKARLHRIGQKRPVVYIHIIAQNTIDGEVMKRLAAKQDIARLVVDDYRNILGGETMGKGKKPYEGLRPGTPEWMEVWKKYPELQDEMLENKKRLEEEKMARVDREILTEAIQFTENGLDEQIENMIDGVEKLVREGGTKGGKKEKVKVKSKLTPVPEIPEDEPKPKKRKEAPKEIKKADEINEIGIITVKELAAELDTDPKNLRKWLRKNLPKPSGRWEWPVGSKEVEKIRDMWKNR